MIITIFYVNKKKSAIRSQTIGWYTAENYYVAMENGGEKTRVGIGVMVI